MADTCRCCKLANCMSQPAGRLSVPVDCLHGNRSITAFQTQQLSTYPSYCASLTFFWRSQTGLAPTQPISSQDLITTCIATVVLLLLLLLLIVQQACYHQLITTALCVLLDHFPTTGLMICLVLLEHFPTSRLKPLLNPIFNPLSKTTSRNTSHNLRKKQHGV